MRALSIDHVNIRTLLFDETVSFYQKVLDLTTRDASSSSGRKNNAWLGVLDGPTVIHVNGLGPGERLGTDGDGPLDHFALKCLDERKCIKRLERLGIAYKRKRLDDGHTSQVVIRDPNNIKVELVFSDPDGIHPR